MTTTPKIIAMLAGLSVAFIAALYLLWGATGIDIAAFYIVAPIYNGLSNLGVTITALYDLAVILSQSANETLSLYGWPTTFQLVGAASAPGAIVGGWLWYKNEQVVNRIEPKSKRLKGMDFSTVQHVAALVRADLLKRRRRPKFFIHPELPLLHDAPNENIFICGSPGSGKTLGVINYLLRQATQNNDKIVLLDFKGDYTQVFGENNHVKIFAPWDKRSVKWSLGLDIENSLECDLIAASSVPADTTGKNAFLGMARGVFAGVIRSLYNDARNSNNNTISWCDVEQVVSSTEKTRIALKKYQSTQKAYANIETDGPQTQAVISTLHDSVKWLTSAAEAWPDANFSLKNWLHSDGGGMLILRYSDEYADLSGSLCSMAVTMLINSLLARPDQKDRNYWFFLDEFPNLPVFDNIDKGLSALRSKGGAFVLAIQDVGQLQSKYGRERAQQIMSNCGTHIYFKLNDQVSADYASKNLGNKEILKRKKSKSESSSENSHSKSTSFNADTTVENVVISGELMNLRRAEQIKGGGAEGFIKMSGYPICKPVWPLTILDKKFESKILADWVYAVEKPIVNKNASKHHSNELKSTENSIDNTEKNDSNTENEQEIDLIVPEINDNTSEIRNKYASPAMLAAMKKVESDEVLHEEMQEFQDFDDDLDEDDAPADYENLAIPTAMLAELKKAQLGIETDDADVEGEEIEEDTDDEEQV